jgi:Mg2+-importing ATPase
LDLFWKHIAAELYQQLNTSTNGLSRIDTYQKQQQQQTELKVQKPWIKDFLLLLSQYKNPLVLLLVFAVILSTISAEYSESIIIFIVLLLTGI